jgi:mixed-linked glucan synthase
VYIYLITLLYLLIHAHVCHRLLTLARLILVAQFFIWRVTHWDSDSMLLWWVTVVGDFWFAVTWLLNQASKLNPVKRVPDIAQLPGLDVLINTVDPVDEPVLYTMNSVLSILATDYVPGRPARHVPLRQKHRVEPRAPESYFFAAMAPAADEPYAGTCRLISSRTGAAYGGSTRSLGRRRAVRW